MKKNIFIIAITGLALLCISCNNFLEPKSTLEFVPEDVGSLNQMLLGESYPSHQATGYWGFLCYLDDDITTRPYVVTTTGTGGTAYQQSYIQADKYLYSWTEDYETAYNGIIIGAGPFSTYRTVYGYITGTNVALDYADGLRAENSNERYNVKAQAHALRAFHYFHLVNIYGAPYNSNPNSLGVPLKLTSGLQKELFTRNTVAECYDQILKDLLAAEASYVAMGDGHVWLKNNRTSLPMVRLMLSRVYLYMENWKESARYARMVMDDPTFSLHDLNDYKAPTPGAPTTEYQDFITYDKPETIWLYGSVSDGFATTGFYTSNSNQTNGSRYALFSASDELVASYEKTETTTITYHDLRGVHYLLNERQPNGNPAPNRVKRAYSKINVGIYSNGRWPEGTASTGSSSSKYGRALRLSEAYLNYAEAMAEMVKAGIPEGSASEAVRAMNDLRKKRFSTATFVQKNEGDFTPDALVQFVRDERRRELCFEGHRWFDLRRWGMPAVAHVWRESADAAGHERFELPQGSKFYAIPLPPSILNMNSSLDPDTWKD